MKHKKIIFIFALVAVTLACGQFSIGIEQPTATIDPVGASVQLTLSSSGIITPTPTETSIALPAWLADPEIPSGETLPVLFAGLSYRDDSVWLVDQSGVSRLVMGQPANGSLSPDGTGYLFSSSQNEGEDIFYLNIAAKSIAQWTDTPQIYESGYQWWRGRPGVIVFNFVPEDELGPWYGYLAAFEISTGDYIIIEDQYGSNTTFALSPDGEQIAYLQGAQPVVYTWGAGTVELDMQGMGMNYQSYSSPAWSPDGTKLAFHASGGESDPTSGATLSATVVVDLSSNTAQVLHEFSSYGRRAEPEITWSPNGEWLAVVNPGEVDPNGDPMAMWVLNLNDTNGVFLGFSSGPIWSPDGQYLVYTSWPPIGTDAPHQIQYVETGVWQPITVTELINAYPETWISLP